MLRADDDARHPYIFFGPKLDFKLSVPLDFKGRALTEWALLAASAVILWWPVGLLLDLLIEPGLFFGVIHIVATWFAGSFAAMWLHRQFVNHDRNLVYVAVVGLNEVRRWGASLTLDPWVAGVAVGVWAVLLPFGRLFGPVRPLWWLLAALGAVLVAQRIVGRLEDPERRWRYQRARARRRPLSPVPVKIQTRTSIPKHEDCP